MKTKLLSAASVLFIACPLLAQQPDWYTGDMHMHASGFVPTSQLITELVATDTNVGHVLVWGPGFAIDAAKFLGHEDDPESLPNHILHWDVEISQLPGYLNGHMIMLNLSDLNVVTPAGVNYPGQDFLLPNYDYVHLQGGLLGFAHGSRWPVGNYGYPSTSAAPRELPLDIALKKVDFLCTETMNAPGFYWLWYQMLDAGFHLTPGAGSDSPGDNPRGTMHTAVPLTAGTPFTFADYLGGMQVGRTVIRNNSPTPDYLDLRVNGQWLGAEIILTSGSVDIEIDASSEIASEVELVVDGQVVNTFPITGTVQTFATTLPISKSSWIAARTVLPGPMIEAHTAATFVLVNGFPIANDPIAALKWAGYLDQYYQWGVDNSVFGASEALVLQKVNEAKEVWTLIAKCGLGDTPAISYCTAGTAAEGCNVMLSSVGKASASAIAGFSVIATGVPGSKDGLLFFGTNGRQANSWGNGTSFQCVVPPVQRLGLQMGNGTPGTCDGTKSQDLNEVWTDKPAKNPGPGALIQVQLWYRDPLNTSNQTTSMSNALEFAVCP